MAAKCMMTAYVDQAIAQADYDKLEDGTFGVDSSRPRGSALWCHMATVKMSFAPR